MQSFTTSLEIRQRLAEYLLRACNALNDEGLSDADALAITRNVVVSVVADVDTMSDSPMLPR